MLRVEQPVGVHQLQRDPVAAVPGRNRQALGPVENARRTDHQWKAAPEVQILDPRLHQLKTRQACVKAPEHARVGVHADQIDTGRRQRDRDAASTHAQVEHGTRGAPAPAEPGLEVKRVRDGSVELREGGVGILRIIANQPAHNQDDRLG